MINYFIFSKFLRSVVASNRKWCLCGGRIRLVSCLHEAILPKKSLKSIRRLKKMIKLYLLVE